MFSLRIFEPTPTSQALASTTSKLRRQHNHDWNSCLSPRLIVCLLVSSGLQALFSRVEAEERPNVILIYLDDQGFGDASCFNSECKFETPNIDRLAAEGLRFTDAHCSDSVCTPSRYGLLTGRYAWRTRLKRGVMGAEGECLIDDGRLTLPAMLRSAGYKTAMVGKWHLGMDFPGEDYRTRDWSQPVLDMPLDKGFDYFFGVPASLNYGVLAWFEGRYAKTPPSLFTAKKPNSRHSDYRIRPPYQESPEATREELGKLGMEVAPDFVDNRCLTRFTDQSIAWMSGHVTGSDAQTPFFLYLPLTSPHYPVCPLPEFHGLGEAGGYGEFMIETDYHVGRILKHLEELEINDETLVILTSDNGPENSWRSRLEEFGHASNRGYRDGKRSVYEGGHRVPFVVRWPSGIENPGTTYDGLICQTDLIATLAELLDVELQPDAGEDSISFLHVFRDHQATPARESVVHHAANGRFAIRFGNWKLLLPHRDQPEELYDLDADPREENDLWAVTQSRDIARRLRQHLTRIVTEGRSTPGPTQSNDTGYWKDLAWLTETQYLQEIKQR